MADPSEHFAVTICGRVAGVVERDAKQSVSLLMDPFYLSIDSPLDLHLGDRIELKVRLNIKELRSTEQGPTERVEHAV